MPSELVVSTHISKTLNYLLFVHNSFLHDDTKFPYLDTGKWHFSVKFEQLWRDAASTLVDYFATQPSPRIDPLLVGTDTNSLRALFVDGPSGDEGFSSSYKSFSAWWNHPCGGESYLDSIGTETMKKIHDQLKSVLKSSVPQNSTSFHIELTYDNFPLDSTKTNYIVIPRSKFPDIRSEVVWLNSKPFEETLEALSRSIMV